MPEKRLFTVDRSGEAELVGNMPPDPLASRQGSAMRIGNAYLHFAGPVTPEEIGDAKYYADPSGRIIDTLTGEIVTPGNGKPSFNLKDILDYEERAG